MTLLQVRLLVTHAGMNYMVLLLMVVILHHLAITLPTFEQIHCQMLLHLQS